MWIALCACLALAGLPEQAGDPVLRRALQRYVDLEYEAALPQLERALAQPGLGEADRRLALAYLGRTRAVLRDAPGATEAFAELLAHDPGYTVDAVESPLIRDAFALARARASAPRALVAPAIVAASVGDTATSPSPGAGAGPVERRPPASAVTTAVDDAEALPAPGPAPAVPTAVARAAATSDGAQGGGELPLWLTAGGAVAAGGLLVAVAAVATWLLWPQAAPGANLGRWELP